LQLALGKRRWRRTHSKRFATAGRLRTARRVWSASDLSALSVRRGTARGSLCQCIRKSEKGNRKVGQASRRPRRRSRPQTCQPARAFALAGQARRLPYV